MTEQKYYKILSNGHEACHGGSYTYSPNRWTKRIVNPISCRSGYHIVTVNNLLKWLYADSDEQLPLELWEVEAEGVTDLEDKSVAERIKLTRLVGTLDEYDLRWLATEFAITCLENTTDDRVANCINTVRAYSLGFTDATELSAAWSEAESAARSAADSAARSAARSAAWSAESAESAESAAWSAAWSAESAAWSAAWSAESAAWSAESAAWSPAWSAAWSAARSVEGQIVLDYLSEGE